MPSDESGNNSSKVKSEIIKRQKSSNDADILKITQDSQIPEHIRQKLNSLFGQIENEFEKLYTENLALKEQIDVILSSRAESSGGNQADKADNTENVDLITPKTSKKSASQISQKIKSTYKTSTSRLANTFKPSGNSGSGRFVRAFTGHSDGVWEVSVSQYDRSIIGTASADYTAKIWYIESAKILLQYYGHRGSVNSIRFNPHNELVLTGSGDQTAHIWKASLPISSLFTDSFRSEDGDIDAEEITSDRTAESSNTHFIHAPLQSFSEHKNVVVAADWFTSRSHIITASWDGTAMLFDIEKLVRLDTLCGHDSELTNVVCHATSNLALTSSKDCSVRLWDLRDSTVKVNAFIGHSASVTSAVFSGTDKIISGSDDKTVKCWDMKNMSAPYVTIRTNAAVNRLSVSPNSGIVAVPHDDRNIRLYDLNGNRLSRLPRSNQVGHTRMVCSTAWNYDHHNSCNLFSAGFEKHVLGWSVGARSGDSKDSKKPNGH